MEEEKKLHPFRLHPVEDKFPWGGERWNLADLGWRDTPARDGWLGGNAMGEIMETYLDRVVGEDIFDRYGQQFPFQVKYLVINGKMPLTVCPGDEDARQRYDSLGKEKLWYVAKAAAGSSLLLGFRKATEVADFFSACMEGSPESLLNQVPVKAGQYFHIPPGIPHCIWGSATIVEISESSALDFRLCGWGSEIAQDGNLDLPLNLVEALDFISYGRFPAENLLGFSLEDRRPEDPQNVVRMLHLPQFTCNIIDLEDALKIGGESFDSCIAYTCVRGGMNIQLPQEDPGGKIDYLPVAEGETVLIPAEVEEFYLIPRTPGTLLLETLVGKTEQDI